MIIAPLTHIFGIDNRNLILRQLKYIAKQKNQHAEIH